MGQFGGYRNDQKSIIEALLKGHDTVVRLKTGGGKSLCFQAPAIISQGVTIVISPLQALCNDQVESFNKKYCTDAVVEFNKKYGEAHPECADFLSDKKPRAEFDLSISELVKKDNEDNIEYKLLYLSPEMLSKPVYRQELTETVATGRLKINMIIFDEAHCLSEWGFSFRESYFQICSIIAHLKKYQDIPIGVFSATLTPVSVEQLKLLLDMKKPKEFGICTDKSASRVKNVSLSVQRDDLNVFILNCDDESPFSRYDYIFMLLENVTFKKCIIYCNFIEQVDTIRWLFLRFMENSGNLSKGSISYHGKMYHSTRLRIIIAGTENAPQEVGDNIGERFLNVQRGQDTSGREIYKIRSCPRLWTYAVEGQEGQIARVPLYKLDGRRYFKWEEYDKSEKYDCSTAFLTTLRNAVIF